MSPLARAKQFQYVYIVFHAHVYMNISDPSV